MNQLIKVDNQNIEFFSQGNQVFCTSLDVARVFNKKHFHILRDIENILNDLEKIGNLQGKSNFGFTYRNMQIRGFGKVANKIRKDPYYNLTRDGFSILAMGFSGLEALKFKLAFIDGFNQMEELLKKKIYSPNKYLNDIMEEIYPKLPDSDYMVNIAIIKDAYKNPKEIFKLNYLVDNRTPQDPNKQ
ncbi:Rha family transcriptional regulator [Campylobacter fetus]|uniref:Rha family transcriptional regulator n=1 Tax=Campylobacter fetus TaxID=196 RepID=UPI0008189824|nr:Rha family transcriptional regulator [Campylobacter fetus]OCR84608.1 antirepressor [Campylobacter fetus subsp. testudinum]OCR95668.1 antirepressor [Campylobacter fetus subsp. testudinum]